MQFEIRRAGIGDEPVLRALRLEALDDSPSAFGSTYERELARTIADWQRWLAPGVTFILEAGGRGQLTRQAMLRARRVSRDRASRGNGAKRGYRNRDGVRSIPAPTTPR